MTPSNARPSAAVMSSERTVQTGAMLLPAGIWRRVFRVLWVVLALNSLYTFAGTIYYTRLFSDHAPARVAAGLSALGWSNDAYFWFNVTFIVIYYVSFFAVSLLIFLLRPSERMALFASVFLLGFGTASAYPPATEYLAYWATTPGIYLISFILNNFLAWPLFVVFLALFPDGRFVPRWIVVIAIYGFIFSVVWGAFPEAFGASAGWLGVLVLISILVVYGGSLYAQVWRYRHHSDAAQRQQTKWLVYGLALIVLVTLGQQLLGVFLTHTGDLAPVTSVTLDLYTAVSSLVFVLLPLSIGVAILRYRLWDIDVLIRRTLTYAILSALLVLIYFVTIVALQRVFSILTGGQQYEIVTVVSTLAIAALFVPLRNRIQALIDRRFYRKKYDAQKVLSEFAETVRDETDLEKLTGRLIQVVQETMQPKSVSVWLSDTEHKPK